MRVRGSHYFGIILVSGFWHEMFQLEEEKICACIMRLLWGPE